MSESIFQSTKNRLSSPSGRWAGIGPYYAMFPLTFAFHTVEQSCRPGGAVLDPFAGRGSSVFAAAVTGRVGVGIEINKVGWLYSTVKLRPAPLDAVLRRNAEIGRAAESDECPKEDLPDFFSYCFTPLVLRYLVTARHLLNWRDDNTDATLMALILVYLHGAKEKSLSNQMRQSKAMSPEYSIRWWTERQSDPPDIDPVAFMEKRLRWRYKYGVPKITEASTVILGDSTKSIANIEQLQRQRHLPQFDLLFTSPPYYNITSYHYDQWLRLWMLGESPTPTKSGGKWQNGFWSQLEYKALLERVFTGAARLMSEDSRVHVRTDAREFTLETTREALHAAFPRKEMQEEVSPLSKSSQTALYGDHSLKPGEVDLILE